MEESKRDPLRGVLIRPASQIGLEDEPISYFNQYTPSEEESSYEPVDNNEILTELRRIREVLEYLPEIMESLVDKLCEEIVTSLSSLKNVRTESPVMWGQKQGKAHQLLADLLADNPEGVEVKQIRSEAAMEGISMQTMRRVKQSMGLESEKRGSSWMWKWPDSQ